MDRRLFFQSAMGVTAASILLQDTVHAGEGDSGGVNTTFNNKTMNTQKPIYIAADPFAIELKEVLVGHLKEKGYQVVDLGATKNKEIPYFESSVAVCKALQKDKADRAILLCGTGMGMAVIANRFKGIVASVAESVFAVKMCRAINNANVLCLGAMIWGDWMAKEAVDTFLDTEFTQGLEPLSGFLREAEKKVDAIRDDS